MCAKSDDTWNIFSSKTLLTAAAGAEHNLYITHITFVLYLRLFCAASLMAFIILLHIATYGTLSIYH